MKVLGAVIVIILALAVTLGPILGYSRSVEIAAKQEDEKRVEEGPSKMYARHQEMGIATSGVVISPATNSSSSNPTHYGWTIIDVPLHNNPDPKLGLTPKYYTNGSNVGTKPPNCTANYKLRQYKVNPRASVMIVRDGKVKDAKSLDDNFFKVGTCTYVQYYATDEPTVLLLVNIRRDLPVEFEPPDLSENLDKAIEQLAEAEPK